MDVRALQRNGCDIRIVFYAAIEMAMYRTAKEISPPGHGQGQPVRQLDLTVDDISKVIRNKTAYRNYLTHVHVQGEELRAQDDGSRRTST